ncbi:MAG: MFS transporter [Bacteroidales bacterium]|nr:MFS transporter [Bacteroidales bacterium]
MKSNIVKLYLIKIAKWFMLFMPIVVLFYQENGLEMQDIFVLQSIYSVVIVILEIPSGYLADVLGRKTTLIIGAVLGFCGFVIYSFSYDFWGFLMAEVTMGIGTSLVSGADSAMLYDTLKAGNQKEKYLKFEGKMVSLGNAAEAVAGILGGLLAEISLRTPFYAQTAVSFIGIPAAILLVEPIRQEKIEKMDFKDILLIVKHSLYGNPHLKWNIIYSAGIGASTLTMAWFVQPYFKYVDLELSLFGVFWTLLNLSVAITSYIAYKVEYRLGQVKTILLITLLLPLFYFILSQIHVIWGISVLFLFYLMRGLATPVLKDYINRLTESSTRATVLSVRNFMIRLLFAGIGPFLGWYTDHYSLSNALALSSVTFFILAAISGTFFLKTRKYTHKTINI